MRQHVADAESDTDLSIAESFNKNEVAMYREKLKYLDVKS